MLPDEECSAERLFIRQSVGKIRDEMNRVQEIMRFRPEERALLIELIGWTTELLGLQRSCPHQEKRAIRPVWGRHVDGKVFECTDCRQVFWEV